MSSSRQTGEAPWVVTPRSSIVGQAVMSGQTLIAAVPSGEANALLIASAPRFASLLAKALPAIVELHVQGIGCPDCPRDVDTEARPEACPFVRELDAAVESAAFRAVPGLRGE